MDFRGLLKEKKRLSSPTPLEMMQAYNKIVDHLPAIMEPSDPSKPAKAIRLSREMREQQHTKDFKHL